MHASSTVRLFVAVHLPEPVRADLGRAAVPLHAALPNVRWVRADAMHLTLVFLGDRPADQVEAIVPALEAACRELKPFVLTVGGNGCFPSAERARVLWTGLAGDGAALLVLQRAVAAALAATKLWEADDRFSPHLTIGRLRDGTPRAARAEAGRRWMNLPTLPSAPIPAGEIHLMRSTLALGGPQHTALQSIALSSCLCDAERSPEAT
jgi:2'-5' RNA ligase